MSTHYLSDMEINIEMDGERSVNKHMKRRRKERSRKDWNDYGYQERKHHEYDRSRPLSRRSPVRENGSRSRSRYRERRRTNDDMDDHERIYDRISRNERDSKNHRNAKRNEIAYQREVGRRNPNGNHVDTDSDSTYIARHVGDMVHSIRKRLYEDDTRYKDRSIDLVHSQIRDVERERYEHLDERRHEWLDLHEKRQRSYGYGESPLSRDAWSDDDEPEYRNNDMIGQPGSSNQRYAMDMDMRRPDCYSSPIPDHYGKSYDRHHSSDENNEYNLDQNRKLPYLSPHGGPDHGFSFDDVQKPSNDLLYISEKIIEKGGKIKYEELKCMFHDYQQRMGHHNSKDLLTVFQESQGAIKWTGSLVCMDHHISICDKYGTCTQYCGNLHICHFFMKGRDCKYKEDCKYGHDMSSPHNIRVLADLKLYGISLKFLRLLYGLSGPVNYPQVCSFYNNSRRGCKHEQGDDLKCPALHVCLHYIKGDCKYGKSCKRCHDIMAPQPASLLKMSGIDISGSIEDILVGIKSKLPKDRIATEDSKRLSPGRGRNSLMDSDEDHTNFRYFNI